MMTTSAFARRSALWRGRRRVRHMRELTAAVLLLGTSTALVNRVLPDWAYPIVNGSTALLLLRLARSAGLHPAAVGLDRRHMGRAAALGLAGLAAVAVAFGVALAVPPFRLAFNDGRLGQVGGAALAWIVLVRIPVGTVLLDEVAFRGVLPGLFGADDRWRWGPVLGASALFGLWHVLPSLALRQNAAVRAMFGDATAIVVSGISVFAAAAAGVVLHLWRYAGGGLLAPALVHLATNSGGALVAWWVLTSADRSSALAQLPDSGGGAPA